MLSNVLLPHSQEMERRRRFSSPNVYAVAVVQRVASSRQRVTPSRERDSGNTITVGFDKLFSTLDPACCSRCVFYELMDVEMTI
jgi:hypothetical protein